MKSFRKLLSAALAVLMAVSMLLMSGCSTPAVAATVDGYAYSTGEYLANLYSNFSIAFYDSGLYQYSSYGMDPWEQTLPYGDGEEKVEMPLADYLVQQTKDGLIRQQAVKNLMEKYGVTVPQEKIDEHDKEMAEVNESELLAYGFNKEHYRNMYIAVNMEESTLFYALYNEGGQKAVPEADVRKHFDDNYVAYKAITMAHTNSEGAALSDADIAANKTTLEGYLAQFNESGDMDAVIAKYANDTATDETAEPAVPETGDTAEENANIQIVEAITGDENLVAAVKGVEVGKAAVVEYTDKNGAKYTALINRLDVETAGGENYYEDQHDTVVYGLKFDEFDKEVEAEGATLTAEFNERAIKMCDPKNFIPEE